MHYKIVWRPSKQDREYVSQLSLGIVLTEKYERILIGNRYDILYRLEGAEVSGILCDEIRPFGSFLLNLDDDKEGGWNTSLMYLAEARAILDKHYWERKTIKEDPKLLEKQAMKILEEKFQQGDLVSQFVSLRIWYGYWSIRENRKEDDIKRFLRKTEILVRPFSIPGVPLEERTRVTPKHPIFRYAAELYTEDKQSTTHTSLGKDNLECIIVTDSLIPIKRFYANRISMMKKHVMKCEICGAFYIANNEKFQYCSDECRKIARKDSLNQRAKIGNTAEIDRLCSDANAHWANRRSKIRKSPEWTAEEVLIYEEQVKAFQTEKREMRKKHKAGQITFSELQDWLIKQHDKAA